MKYLSWVAMLVVSLFMFCALSQTQAPKDNATPSPVFRPFTLRLHIDKEHYYEEHFDKIPYVEKNDVYLFSGENFGINLVTAGDEISRVTYQPGAAKADVCSSSVKTR